MIFLKKWKKIQGTNIYVECQRIQDHILYKNTSSWIERIPTMIAPYLFLSHLISSHLVSSHISFSKCPFLSSNPLLNWQTQKTQNDKIFKVLTFVPNACFFLVLWFSLRGSFNLPHYIFWGVSFNLPT